MLIVQIHSRKRLIFEIGTVCAVSMVLLQIIRYCLSTRPGTHQCEAGQELYRPQNQGGAERGHGTRHGSTVSVFDRRLDMK